jgi:transposase
MAANAREKSYCVLEFAKTNSVTVVQRHFRTRFGRRPPTRQSIYDWCNKFETTGCLCKGKSSGRPRVAEETVERVRAVYQRSPKKSTTRASLELQVPQQTVWKILRKRLKMTPYKLQILQHLREDDKIKRLDFCSEMLQRNEEDDNFCERIIFSDESTFHLSGKVNKQNVRIWGTEHPRETVEHVRDSPKVNVFCAISHSKVYGPFFFEEKTVTGATYHQMLMNWLLPQLREDGGNFIFQQDGAPPHWHRNVRHYLNEALPQRWIGRATNDDSVLIRWPPRSPDLTPCDFFLWGYVKDKVYVPPLTSDLDELKQRITRAVESINVDMLHRVWNELDYRLDVCRVTRGAHIEHL